MTEATGHTVVLTATIEVTTDIERAGQLVTVGAQLVMVETMVLKTVDVVIGVPFEYTVRPLPWVPGLWVVGEASPEDDGPVDMVIVVIPGLLMIS